MPMSVPRMVTFPISEGISMSAGYRYFKTQDFVYEDFFGEELEALVGFLVGHEA